MFRLLVSVWWSILKSLIKTSFSSRAKAENLNMLSNLNIQAVTLAKIANSSPLGFIACSHDQNTEGVR
jgi:hypothetical protein